MKRNTITYQSGLVVLKHQSEDPEQFELRVIGKISTAGDMDHNGDLTIGENLYVTGYADIGDDLTVRGNLFVKGESVQVDSQISTADRILIMNDGEAGNGVTGGFSGISIDRGSSPNYEFGFNEQSGLFELGEENDRQPVATRELSPTNQALLVWNSTNNRLESTTANVTRDWLQLQDHYYDKSEIDSMVGGGGGSGSGITAITGDGNSNLTITNVDNSTVSTNLQHTHNNIQVNAGNGLTGGGDLGSDITISMGSPSTIGSGTTNSSTANSHTHELNLSSDDIPSLDWTNKISGKPFGLDGQTYFFDGDGTDVTNDYTLVSGRFVMNEAQLMDEQQNTISFGEIFDTWRRFSHSGSQAQPANLSETNSWRYDEDLDQVFSTVNSGTFIGMYSNQRYDTYTHEVTIGATAGDDDPIGVVIAFGLDFGDMVTNNLYQANPDSYNWDINSTDQMIPKENTLTVLRNRTYQSQFNIAGERAQYALVYNYLRSDQVLLANGNDMVENISSSYQGNSCRVRVERNGDQIRVWTTDWTDTSAYDGELKYMMEYNLNDIPQTQKLRGPQSYGYGAHSQANATYSDVDFTDPSGRIYDLPNGNSYTYDGSQWVQQTENAQSEIGKGRFLFNPRYKSLNYIDSEDEIQSIVESEIRLRGGYTADYTSGDITIVGGTGIQVSQAGNEIIISEAAQQMQTFSTFSTMSYEEDTSSSNEYLAGIGLTLDGNIFNVTNPVNSKQINDWDQAFHQRGSQIAGTGLTWNRSALDIENPLTDDILNKINDSYAWGNHQEQNYARLGSENNDVRSNSQMDVRYARTKENNVFTGSVTISNGNDTQLVVKKSTGSGLTSLSFEHSDSNNVSGRVGIIGFKPNGTMVLGTDTNDINLSLSPSGNLWAKGKVSSTGFSSLADSTKKQNSTVANVVDDSELLKLRIMQWMWTESGETDTGVSAEEVAEVFPTCVNQNENGDMEVDYGKLAFHMVATMVANKNK